MENREKSVLDHNALIFIFGRKKLL